jgi:alkanesulfonate monooxygenase SsuD/methylene tetrahydromethanopterin reductase-like flavin-dependent oxidoreductase (luciferase family)
MSNAPRDIRFGVTVDFRNPPPRRPFPEVYAEALDRIALADHLGFDYVYLTEHHFVEDGHCPSLLVVAGAIAARTTRIKISSYVFLLPFHNPLRLAEDVAVADIISNGRIELGVGAGYRLEEFEGYGIDRRHRPTLMDEGCEVLLKAWTEDNWSFHGRHHHFSNVSVHPKPVRQPFPPLWISARAAPAARRAARFDAPLQISPPPYVVDERAVYEAYRDHLLELGRDPLTKSVAAQFHCAVTDDPAGYRARTRPGLSHRASLYVEWQTAADDLPGDGARVASRPPRIMGAIGDPATCIEALEQFIDTCGYPVTHIVMGLDEPAEMEAFATQVMPHFQDAAAR